MDLKAIQRALKEQRVDGWLFYDFHHRDPVAYHILGLDPASMTSRRWFYWIPAEGEPVKLAHKVEPHKLDSLPGRQRHYLAWNELHEALRGMLAGASKVAMQYSPMCNIPYVSLVDGGTIELVRSTGCDVVTSAALVQQFEAVTGDAGYKSHAEAGERVQAIKDEAFAMLAKALRDGRPVNEFEVKEFILSRFAEEGMTSDGASPIVGFNDHPADPHFEPTRDNAYALSAGDTVLIDLWARMERPDGIYYDVTWCAYAGAEPPRKYAEIFGVVCRARDAALELVRSRFSAGDPCHGFEVDDACRAVVRDSGYGEYFVHRTGHSIGGEVHGNGANIDNLETRDDRPLVPGICFSIEPGIYLAGEMAVRSEIDVFITEDGVPRVVGPIQQDLLLLS